MNIGHIGRVFLVALMLVPSGWARAEVLDIGPKVGTKIPGAFAVSDQHDAPKTFQDVVGAEGAVLAFVRSAAWCPYCQTQMKDLQAIAGPLSERGYRLVAISYDKPEVLAKFAEKSGITYPLLSDKGSVLIDAFGIRDPQYKEGSFAFGVPMPVIFIVDKGGVVRAKLAEESYKTRPQIAAIVAAVDAAQASR